MLLGFYSKSSSVSFHAIDQHEDVWLVQLQNGAVRVMTLDELDTAFQDGAIDEETFVRRDGTSKWIRLREELGGDEVVAQPAAPVASPTPAPVSYGAVPAYQPLYSTRPVVSEIDHDELGLDDLDSPFKKSRKGMYAGIGIGAVAVIALAIVGATKIGSAAPPADVNASVVQAAQPPQVQIPPPPLIADTQPALKLNDDTKKALSAKDSQFNKRQDALKKDRAQRASSAPATHKTQPPPFSKTGSAYDPLNAKL